jgi:hypothetical protein
MMAKRNHVPVMGIVLATAVALIAASPAVAQDGTSDCVCIVDAGTVGMVTSATGWVKLNGDVGLVDATMNAPLSVGSVLRTGVAGSAAASVGAGCNVEVAALTEMSISALEDGRMCVRLTQDTPVVPVAPVAPLAMLGGGAILAGGAIAVGLGQDSPVSQ